MDFQAEIKQVSASKQVSNDITYKLVLETSNPLLLDLGKLPSDTIVTVSIEVVQDSLSNKL